MKESRPGAENDGEKTNMGGIQPRRTEEAVEEAPAKLYQQALKYRTENSLATERVFHT